MNDLESLQRAFRVAVLEGGESARALHDRLPDEWPIPRPWWFASIRSSLRMVLDGAQPDISPDQFDDLEGFAASRRRVAERTAWTLFNPFWRNRDRSEQYLESQQRLVRELLESGTTGNWFIAGDRLIAPLLAEILERACNVGQAHLYPITEKLTQFLDRLSIWRENDSLKGSFAVLRQVLNEVGRAPGSSPGKTCMSAPAAPSEMDVAHVLPMLFRLGKLSPRYALEVRPLVRRVLLCNLTALESILTVETMAECNDLEVRLNFGTSLEGGDVYSQSALTSLTVFHRGSRLADGSEDLSTPDLRAHPARLTKCMRNLQEGDAPRLRDRLPSDPALLHSRMAELYAHCWSRGPSAATGLLAKVERELQGGRDWWLPYLRLALRSLCIGRGGVRPTPDEFEQLDPLRPPEKMPWLGFYHATYLALRNSSPDEQAFLFSSVACLARLGIASAECRDEVLLLLASMFLDMETAGPGLVKPESLHASIVRLLASTSDFHSQNPLLPYALDSIVRSQQFWNNSNVGDPRLSSPSP